MYLKMPPAGYVGAWYGAPSRIAHQSLHQTQMVSAALQDFGFDVNFA
jgi:hypothetical protein